MEAWMSILITEIIPTTYLDCIGDGRLRITLDYRRRIFPASAEMRRYGMNGVRSCIQARMLVTGEFCFPKLTKCEHAFHFGQSRNLFFALNPNPKVGVV